MNIGTIIIFGLIALAGLVLILFFLLRSGSTGGEMEERISRNDVPPHSHEHRIGAGNDRRWEENGQELPQPEQRQDGNNSTD